VKISSRHFTAARITHGVIVWRPNRIALRTAASRRVLEHRVVRMAGNMVAIRPLRARRCQTRGEQRAGTFRANGRRHHSHRRGA
jgi:hypothetical protein